VQRLFSMFPNAWPGAGLLLLRLVSGALLIYQGPIGPRSMVLQPIAAVAGAILIVGLWTPVVGAFVMAFELWRALTMTQDLRSAVLLGTIGAALAMIGPGATSLDNLRFGRKRIDD
jgi:uncharacterized membrane protein YphA (DoxX/SURF4 family)